MSTEEHARVIAHFDIDAFYAQVEEVANPELKSKPLGVYQKTIIVTSNYVAREYGIKKCMLTTEAIKLCPNLFLVNGENLEKYRQVSEDLTKFIQEKYKVPVEKLGFDENFVDISRLVDENSSSHKSCVNEGNLSDEEDFTSNPLASRSILSTRVVDAKFVLGKRKSEELEINPESTSKKAKVIASKENDCNVIGHVYNNTNGKCPCGCIRRICLGTHIANDMRQEIYNKFHLTLSAGISFNKLLAKLVCSLHKPNQQTVIFPNSVLHLMSTVNLRQIPGIGSKLFDQLANALNIKTVEDLQSTRKAILCKEFDSATAEWLLNVAYGKDFSRVKMFSKQSSIGVEDRYHRPITRLDSFKKEALVLLDRLIKLVRKDGRTPRLLKIHLRFDHFKYEFKLDSKQCPISPSVVSNADQSTVEKYLLDVVTKLYKELCAKKNSNTITYINIAVGNFIDIADSQNSILKFCQKTPSTSSCALGLNCQDDPPTTSNFSKDSNSPDLTSSSDIVFNEANSRITEEVTNSSTHLESTQAFSSSFTLNVDNVDKNVLNELPDDIRKEIEQELNRQHMSDASCSRNTTSSTTTNSKKKPRQLSMLNFVRRK